MTAPYSYSLTVTAANQLVVNIVHRLLCAFITIVYLLAYSIIGA